MSWHRIVTLGLVLVILSGGSAEAGPVVGLITTIAEGIAAFAKISALNAFLVRTGLSIGLSLLAQAVRGKPRASGLRSEATTTGGTTPQTFGVGLFATAGQLLAPPNSYGKVGDTPRAYLVYPIALSVVPGCTLNRLIVNDAYIELAGAPSAEFGHAAVGELADFLRVDYLDGSQTTAHPDMLDAFGNDPDRPWEADMVGPGLCAAFLRFRYSRKRFNGLPSVRFEMLGIPLYDPRADSTVGGSGTQRWNDRATWAQTSNLPVIIYNILRGINVGGGLIWGGECTAEELPLSRWMAAMNVADVAIDDGDGGTAPQYHGGIEIALDHEPASVIEELLKACSGQMVEVGGIWDIHIGPPAMPSYFISDDDVLISEEQSFDPAPGLSDTFNGITASYPDPDSLWQPKDAPPRYNTEWETEDGGRRLVADLQLPACPFPEQVQRIMAAIIADHRRMRRHQYGLPPEAVVLSPLETMAWTSARYGYTAKAFEITGVTERLMTMVQGFSVRERDAGDFAWTPGTDLIPAPPSPIATTPVPAQAVPGFGVSAPPIVSGTLTARRPIIDMVWDAERALDARGIRWQARLEGAGAASITGTHGDIEDGTARIVAGLLPATDYEVRAALLVDREVTWTGWLPITTGNVGLALDDLAEEVLTHMTETAELAGVTPVTSLPASGDKLDQIVLLVPDGILYRWNGTAWTTELYSRPVAGSITTAAFASSIRPVEILASLPAGPHGPNAGRIVYLTTEGKIYRNMGAGWIVSTDGADITAGSIVAGKIAAGAISTAELSVGFGGNWAHNPDFFGGTSGWIHSNAGDAVGVTTMTLRGPGGTYAGLQYPVLQIFQSTAGSSGYTDVLNGPIYNDSGSQGIGYPVKPDDRLQAYAYFSTHRCTGNIWIQFLDKDGVNILTASLSAIPTDSSDANNPDLWPQIGGFATAPAGAAYARIFIRKFATATGANSFMMIHKPFLGLALINQTEFTPWDAGRSTKISNGQILTDAINTRTIQTGSVVTDSLAAGAVVASKIATGTITSALLNTTSLGVAGLAIFGGTLQSTNFVAGVSGWRITNAGDAEFNSLINRSDLADGSVSDKPQAIVIGPVHMNHADNQVLLTLDIGPTISSDIYSVSLTFEVNNHNGAGLYKTLILQRRVAPVGGSLGAWGNIYSLPAVALGAGWQPVLYVEHMAGLYDDVEYRIVYNGPGDGGADDFRKVYLTLQVVRK